MSVSIRIPVLFATALLFAACGGKGEPQPASQAAAPAAEGDLTPFQLENGIGPITEPVTLAAVDPAMAKAGEAIFTQKCSACHKMAEKYVGPALGEVTTRRTPAFIMNMILNPQEMYTRHPVVKKLLGEYMTQMPNQGLTQEQAREVVEYLRTTTPPAPAQ